jgi:hypothetical protein
MYLINIFEQLKLKKKFIGFAKILLLFRDEDRVYGYILIQFYLKRSHYLYLSKMIRENMIILSIYPLNVQSFKDIGIDKTMY